MEDMVPTTPRWCRIGVNQDILVEMADRCVYTAVDGVASAWCGPRGWAGRYILSSIQLCKVPQMR
jgi:hypothetical protein